MKAVFLERIDEIDSWLKDLETAKNFFADGTSLLERFYNNTPRVLRGYNRFKCIQGMLQCKHALDYDMQRLRREKNKLLCWVQQEDDREKEIKQREAEHSQAILFAQTTQQAIEIMEKIFKEAGFDQIKVVVSSAEQAE